MRLAPGAKIHQIATIANCFQTGALDVGWRDRRAIAVHWRPQLRQNALANAVNHAVEPVGAHPGGNDYLVTAVVDHAAISYATHHPPPQRLIDRLFVGLL